MFLFKNRKKVIIFLHIPKTAGTRIRQLIIDNVGIDKFLHIEMPQSLWFTADSEIANYDAVAAHMGHGLLNRINRQYYAFTFLRDPVERVISLYYYWRNQPVELLNPCVQLAKDFSLEDMLLQDHPLISASIENAQTWFLFHDGDITVRHQNSNITPEVLLEKAKSNLCKLDFVGIQENFAMSVAYLEKALGWKPQQDKKVNTTPNKPKSSELSPKTIEIIKEKVGLDIKLYKFGKEIAVPGISN